MTKTANPGERGRFSAPRKGATVLRRKKSDSPGDSRPRLPDPIYRRDNETSGGERARSATGKDGGGYLPSSSSRARAEWRHTRQTEQLGRSCPGTTAIPGVHTPESP
jgi:hypothetical protein